MVRPRHNLAQPPIAAPRAATRTEQAHWITVALWTLFTLDAIHLVNGILALDAKFWPYNRVRPERTTERARYTSANNGRSSATREERAIYVSYCQQLSHLGHEHDVTLAHHCVTIVWALGILRDAGYTFDAPQESVTFSNQSQRTSGTFYNSGGERASKKGRTAPVRQTGQEHRESRGVA